uniref:D-2-hydroxyglutarate dehydrogenase, mitochondrial n=1 Tax=Syphacia muris TaxID=451379 RepID=A0A0N5AT80_9BILA
MTIKLVNSLLGSAVRLAKSAYHSAAVPRAAYAVIDDHDLSAFEKIVGKNGVNTCDVDPYNTDFLKAYKGSSKCVLSPKSAEEVSAILRHCYERRLAVVPQSGNTGLVGGSVPVYDEVIVSLKKLARHFHFDPLSAILVCDAGFILEDVNNRLSSDGFMVPWDLASKGSCLIGGNVSTCVGGIRRLRFGSPHNHILGVRVALADAKGTIAKFGSGVRKDNTNLHLHQLFVGSEGQLGIITEVTMTAVPCPNSIQMTILGCKTYHDCRRLLLAAKSGLGEILSAFEMIDSEAMRCVVENESLSNVLPTNPPYNVIIETMGSVEKHDKEKVEKFLEKVLNDNLAIDGVQAKSAQERERIWKLRRLTPTAPMKDGYVYKHDISLPNEHFHTLSEIMKERLGELPKRVITYGHMADGDSHINVSATHYSQEIENRLYPFMCKWIVEHGGSVSAEHGVGQERRQYAALGKGHQLNIAKMLKKQFDPKGILSPYKMIDF